MVYAPHGIITNAVLPNNATHFKKKLIFYFVGTCIFEDGKKISTGQHSKKHPYWRRSEHCTEASPKNR